MTDWLNYGWIINALIIGAIIVGFVITTLLVVVAIKPRLKQKSFKYFYAFSAGFMTVVATFGLYGEGKERFEDMAGGDITGMNILWVILCILGGIGVAVAAIMMLRKVMHPTKGEEITKTKHKWVGILMVFIHRIPASVAIGMLAITPAGHGALLLGIMLHVIPEVLILYYRQTEMGYTTKKAVLISIGIKVIFFVMIILGACIGKLVGDILWLQAVLFIMAGTTMIYAVIAEIVPEFIGFMNPHHHAPHHHEEQNNTVDSIEHIHEVVSVSKKLKRSMIILSAWLMIGLALAFIVLTATNA